MAHGVSGCVICYLSLLGSFQGVAETLYVSVLTRDMKDKIYVVLHKFGNKDLQSSRLWYCLGKFPSFTRAHLAHFQSPSLGE